MKLLIDSEMTCDRALLIFQGDVYDVLDDSKQFWWLATDKYG